MEDREKMSVVIGEVRGNDRLNKLLFRLGTYQNKLVILLKQHGIDSCYMIPVSDLLEPFVTNRDAIETATTVSLDLENQGKESEIEAENETDNIIKE